MLGSYETYASICQDVGRKEDAMGRRWRFRCPVCLQPEQLRVNVMKPAPRGDGLGGFICHCCGFRGYTAQLVHRFGGAKEKLITTIPRGNTEYVDWSLVRTVYSQATALGTLQKDHADWLKQRGINPDLGFFSSDGVAAKLLKVFNEEELLQSGLFRYNRWDSSFEPTLLLKRGRVCIPYYSDLAPDQVVYLRSRVVGMTKTEGDPYCSPSRIPQNHAVYLAEQLKGSIAYLIISEGELKAAAAWQLGLHAIGLPGMNSSHQQAAKIAARHHVKRVYIVFDTESGWIGGQENQPKQYKVDDAARRLARHFREHRIIVRHIRLPLLGEEKMDLDRYILLNGASAKEKLRHLAQESEEFPIAQ